MLFTAVTLQEKLVNLRIHVLSDQRLVDIVIKSYFLVIH